MSEPERGKDFAGTMDVINHIHRRIDKIESELDSHNTHTQNVNNSLIRLEERYNTIFAAIELQRSESSAIRTGILISTISAIIAAGMGMFLAGAKLTTTPPTSTQHATNVSTKAQ